MPLALLGIKALVYDDPAPRTSWAPHATDGFYHGPATNHYRCLHFYIPTTQRFRFSNTWRLYPSHCQVPTTSEHDSTLLAAADLLQHLGRAIPTMTTAKLKHLNAIRKLTTIMSGKPNAPPPILHLQGWCLPHLQGWQLQHLRRWPGCLTSSRHQTPSNSCPSYING